MTEYVYVVRNAYGNSSTSYIKILWFKKEPRVEFVAIDKADIFNSEKDAEDWLYKVSTTIPTFSGLVPWAEVVKVYFINEGENR